MNRKVVLITGGNRGIGKKTALTFAENNFDVVLTYNTQKDLAQKVQKEVESLGVLCFIKKCDISKEGDVQALFDDVIKKFHKVDVLVNNAGISIDTLFCDKTAENFKKILDVNLVGTFLVSKCFGEEMFKQKSGKIVNVASTNGINTYFPMCLDYDASKAGIISLTHNLAMQFAPYVNVNCVAPGFIATESEIKDMDKDFIKSEEEKIFKKRAGTEQDVANLIFFLSSENADFINSEVIRIDGGMYGE
ncbi:MAG: SDR family oxidoreductase [Clostridia bacterium]|nr:SDR family oxidoreductase [Clostridia bacterium]